MMGGAPSGTRLAEPGVELPRLAWADTIGLPSYDAPEEFAFGRRGRALAPHADFRPLFPAAADGIVYVQNGSLVAAYNLFARRPERLWQFRPAQPRGEVMFDDRVVYAVTVHDGRAYANLIAESGGSEVQLGYVQVKFPFPRRALYALDAYTGRLLWRKGGVLGADTLDENATFATPPTPERGLLYVGAVKQKLNTDPFEHHVMCLDPATGRTLWSTFVASGGTEINLFNNSTRESLGSPVCVSGDDVFYSTHHGAVAALDRKSGRVRWIFRYEQLPVQPTRSVYIQKHPLQWVNGPPIAAEGIVVVAPTDSRYAYGLDAATGEFRWSWLRSPDLRFVVGARGDVLVLGGERLEFLNLRTGTLAAQPGTRELRGTGRAVAAADGVVVAGQDKLRRVRWDGSWDEEQARAWPGGEGEGGNLLVVDGAVIVASQDAIQVYYDRRDQERAVRQALEGGGGDPALLYRAALRFLQAGDPAEAATLFSKVVARTRGEERLHRAARKRLFAVSMEAGRGELEARRSAEAVGRFRAAREAAPDPGSEIEASVGLGRALLAAGKDAEAVAEYQRLLAERGEAVWEGKRVFDVARNAVAAIVAAAGPGSYAKEEAAARALLARARREGTGAAYAEVFRLYPNSAAAEEALFEAAQAQARLERLDDEIAAWRLFAREFGESARTPEALARLVHALERKGHFASAASALRRLARGFPEADVPDGEGRVKGRVFAERRLKSEPYARASAETPPVLLAPPLKKAFETTEKVFPEGAPLRVLGTPPPSAAGLLFMRYGDGRGGALRALDRKGAVAWSLEAGSADLFAAFLEDALLVADEGAVWRVNPADGKAERLLEGKRLRRFTLAGSTLYFFAADPRDEAATALTALDAVRGAVLWSESFEGVPSRPLPAGTGVAFTTVSPNRLHVFDQETGKRRLEAPCSTGLSVQVAHATEDSVVLLSEGRFLESYSLLDGALRWKQSLAGVSLRGLEVAGGELVLLGLRPKTAAEDQAFLWIVNLKSGKLARVREKLEAADPRYLHVEDGAAVVVSREPDGRFAARSVGLADLLTRWEAVVGGGKQAMLLPPGAARDHLVVSFFEPLPGGGYACSAALLDKRGGVVQNIRSDGRFERPPEVAVAHDAVIFSVDSKVEVHR
jgi:outer membrane protein assembly factor BamB/TolA-binding protein